MRGAGDFWAWHEYRGRGTGGVGIVGVKQNKDEYQCVAEGLGFIAYSLGGRATNPPE